MRKYYTVFILSSFSFSTVCMNIVSFTLHFTVRNILGLSALLHTNFSHSCFEYNLIYITYICTFTLHLPLFVPLQIMSCFTPQLLSHCHFWSVYQSLYVQFTSSFYSLPILLCPTNPLIIFLSLVSLLYVKLVLHMVPSLHHIYTVTNIPTFCSVVHLSSFLFMQALSFPQQCCQKVRSSGK
jgi:hypothetical protein